MVAEASPARRARVMQLFRYFGSKARMAPALAEAVPEGTRQLVSPFFGSGVFEYNWAAAHPDARVVGYDVDPAVVNFHHIAQTRRKALHGRIMALRSTSAPDGVLTKDEYAALLRAGLSRGLAGAARFYVVSQHSYSGKIGSYARPDRFREPTALESPLPPNVEVRLGDAHEALAGLARRAPPAGAFVYMDPPYFVDRTDYYTHAAFDHARLAEEAHRCRAPWLLSYNDAPEVRRLYAGRATLSLPARYRALKADGSIDGVLRTELLVASGPIPRPVRVRVRRAYAASR